MRFTGKMFCIGLTKTGTSSLHEALKRLGYNSNHDAQGITKAVDQALAEGLKPLHYLEEFDAFTCSGYIWQKFKDLDAHYPGSKFILTNREEKSWLASMERHMALNQFRPNYKGKVRTFNAERQLRTRSEHHADVRDYFKDRPDDLLEISIMEGEGYEKLCPFLGVETVEEQFPSLNSAVERLQKAIKKSGKKVKLRYQD